MDLNQLKEIADFSPHKIIKLLLFLSLFFNYTLMKDKDIMHVEHQADIRALNKIHAVELKFKEDKINQVQEEKINYMKETISGQIYLERVVDSIKQARK